MSFGLFSRLACPLPIGLKRYSLPHIFSTTAHVSPLILPHLSRASFVLLLDIFTSGFLVISVTLIFSSSPHINFLHAPLLLSFSITLAPTRVTVVSILLLVALLSQDTLSFMRLPFLLVPLHPVHRTTFLLDPTVASTPSTTTITQVDSIPAAIPIR